MLVTFRLSVLGIGGTERVFLSVADFLSSTYGWSIDFVVDRITGEGTEPIAIANGYRLISLSKSRTWKTVLPLARYMRSQRPNIVISAYTETNAAALISNALNLFSTPTIVTEHASLDEHWSGKPWYRKVMLECMVRYIYKMANRAVCVSRGMANQLSSRLKHTHVSFIHNPVRFAVRTKSKQEARLALGVADDVPMVLAVGRISRQKNYLMLLQAFKNLVSVDNAQLYIVGGIFEADEKLKLDKFIEENRLNAQVHFVDFTHEIHSYYESADMLVLSSAWEGFGNVIVEALAFGLPVVSTRCNFGPAEILADGEFGVLVDVDDYIAMGNALHLVLTQNPFNASEQIQRAESFTEAKIGEAYHKLICETAGIIEAR